jgi:DNA topoisomerase-1
MSHVVIVESPAKAKTINKYLGKDYTVLASYGHVRDLPSKDGSVLPDQDFEMFYEVDDGSKRQITAIVSAVKGADSILLATDPDREGEAISWHVLEVLKQKKAIGKNTVVRRITFNEITKKAILDAVAHPRDIDMDLVNAQQARRALDYLTGFTLSPVLWRKLPGSRSAGRVQSVALRAICEREEEIEAFVTREYWDITVQLQANAAAASLPFSARLTHWDGEKLEKFSLTNEQQATAISRVLEGADYRIRDIEQKQMSRNPAAPFTTSTLQQEASRKLGFGASRTMQVAQKLYEGVELGGETVGLITYMRTDGVTLGMDAINDIRREIGSNFGQDYVPSSPRMYKTKAKNAQEAHEAIRPTDITRTPAQLRKVLSDEQFKLYELIWKRTVASQMASAILDQTAFVIDAAGSKAQLRATGTVTRFPGFLAVYQEGQDDNEDEESRQLPALEQGTNLKDLEVKPEQHFTEPPPRYSEASLVKRLEELGIGRPSTYAAILSVLQDRQYVTLDKKRFIPEARGRIVNAFLVSFFRRYVEYDFTAQLEDRLDQISAGELEWKAVLTDWWKEFSQSVAEAKELRTTQVLDEMDQLLGAYIFGSAKDENHDPRQCPSCSAGKLSLKLGKFGAFVGCSNYPDCNYTRQLSSDAGANAEAADEAASSAGDGPRELGADPATGMTIWLKKGPYGWYVQLGEGTGKKENAPKRASLTKGLSPDAVTLQVAIDLLALPRDVGTHPETGEMIVAGIGRYGPYLLHAKKYTNLPAGEDPLTSGSTARWISLQQPQPKVVAAALGQSAYLVPTQKVAMLACIKAATVRMCSMAPCVQTCRRMRIWRPLRWKKPCH